MQLGSFALDLFLLQLIIFLIVLEITKEKFNWIIFVKHIHISHMLILAGN